jgi:predicted PurR-regulated permease PerM
VTLVGALGGIRYFGLLGILIGPLALSYFFELIRMYREEYVAPAERVRRSSTQVPVVAPAGNPSPSAGSYERP